MDYYEKNMECMKEHRNHMYQSVMNADIEKVTNRLDDVISVETRDGQLAVAIRYQQEDYRLNSLYNPAQEAQKWVEQFDFRNINNVIAMYGLGNGIFARAIISRMNKGDTLVIYEPCAELFFHVLHHYDMTDLLCNPSVIIAVESINEFDFHNILQQKMDVTNIKGIIKCIYPGYDEIFTESCILFWKELKDAHNHAIIQANTGIAFGRVYIENLLKNIKYLPASSTIYELKKTLPKGVPAIVVAAGPSLSGQIESLRKAKGKAVIVAVDRILDVLLDLGIVPDFVFTLDPIKPVEYFTKRQEVSIPLLSFIVSNNKIFEIHKGKKFICNCSKFLVPFYKDINKIPPAIMASGSVATAAFTACVELGFENIILVGQDLAYQGNATHAGGIEEKLAFDTDIMVEGINGEMVKSRYDWKEFLVWYQDFLTIYPSVNVIDAKDSGAKIKGTKNMSLEEAMAKYSKGKEDFSVNEELLAQELSKEETDKLKDYLNSGVDQLTDIEAKAKKAIKICDRLIRDNEKNILSKEIDKNLKSLKKINTFILEKKIYLLMDTYVTAVTTHKLADIYQFTDNLKNDSLSTYISSKVIFEAIIEAIDLIMPLLKKAIEEIR